MPKLSKLKTYKKLQQHYDEIKTEHLKNMFEANNNRFAQFSVRLSDILVDYSKNLINAETIDLLCDLADEAGLKPKIEAMFTGEKINNTENRQVLHTALRNMSGSAVYADGVDVMPEINEVKSSMKKFVKSVHTGKWLGASGKRIDTIVNIGIGGSDLGPRMVCEALRPYAVENMKVYFVSNVDGTDILNIFDQINPETTLFIIASKTFTTQETMTNANTAKKLFLSTVAENEKDVAKHFVAVSTNEVLVKKFGINPKNMFKFWDWVGGRYSLWSAIGLSIALYVGYDNYEKLLEGAYEMDVHFRETNFHRNIPVLLGLLGVWYNNFYNANTNAIIPYDQYLLKFADFLQQLDMESNGKQVTIGAKNVDYKTGPVIWGAIGTNAQHSFFQLIHQGTQIIPADFLAPVNTHNEMPNHHDIFMSNFFAQTEALMKGKSKQEVIDELKSKHLSDEEIENLYPHKIFPGNKPTNTILYKELTPQTLGSLIAMYEHKVFVQGVIWDINSFDQWGVELGKQLAKEILPELQSPDIIISHDCSTNSLINYYKSNKIEKEYE